MTGTVEPSRHDMNYCPNCGAPLGVGQNFCRNCGLDIREGVPSAQRPPTPIRGLGRNTIVYLTGEGLLGAEIRSTALLLLAMLAPLAGLAAVYFEIQTGALAGYIAVWVALSTLLYDELRWRGVRSLGEEPPAPGGGRRSWLVPWPSIHMADWNGRTLWFASTNPRRKLSITLDRSDALFVERTLDSWGVRYSWRSPKLPPALTRFSTLVLLLFIAGQVILILAATLPFFPGEEQAYATILNNTQSQIAGTTFIGEFRAILLNNIQVALGGAIPFLGTFTYGVASYNTGRVVQAIAITHQPSPVPPYAILVSLYLLPHTWVEEFAYPIATIAGVFALTKWRSVSPRDFSRTLNRGSTKFVLALAGSVAVLAVAGLLEVLATYLKDGVILLWVPLAALYYLVARTLRRRQAGISIGSP